MAKEAIRNYDNQFKKLNMSMYIIMGMLLLLVIIFLVTSCSNKQVAAENETEYDVSMMHTVGVSDILDMFDTGNTYVLYIGRETCDVCYDLLPVLQEAQIKHNYITQYLDISDVDRSGENWLNLVELLDRETTTTIDEEGIGEKVTDTFGNFINERGFTPCVVIIRDGKQAGGFFGSYSLVAFEDWLDNYGI